MTDTVRFPLVLGVISLCSAAGLAISYTATRDRIRLQEELKKARGIAGVLAIELDTAPDAKRPWRAYHYRGRRGEPGVPFVVYEAADPETRQRLYAAEGSAQGYSSKVRVVVGVDQSVEGEAGATTIRAIRVINQLETPGLGDRCRDEEFQRQFERLPEAMLELIKGRPYRDPDAPNSPELKVAAITGASVTSLAVTEAVRQAVARIRHHVAQRRSAD